MCRVAEFGCLAYGLSLQPLGLHRLNLSFSQPLELTCELREVGNNIARIQLNYFNSCINFQDSHQAHYYRCSSRQTAKRVTEPLFNRHTP